MPAVTIRPFRIEDLRPVVALWNTCLFKDPITEERFWRLFLLDANFDPDGALVAEAEGEIVGFLQAITRKTPLGSVGLQPQTGWITVFFVHPDRRRQGIASRLREAGLAFLRREGRTEVFCNGYAPYYIFPGVDVDYREGLAFLEASGFTRAGEPVAMGMPLEGVRMPEPVRACYAALQQEGCEVRMFAQEDTLALLAFAEEHFPAWQPSLREGLLRDNTEIVLATKNGQIAGFAQWQNPHNDPPDGAPGRFGPFGVRDDLRSRGIGAVIFYTLIERVAGNGARYLWFGWAGGRNVGFYERAGCRITRRFRLYKRGLEPVKNS
ncbi:MAG TPA: GNAT family N-acetyltransferase [Chthonomonadaceae bacterium]|nr:GNAT family N-acetyltransferase [Chthonomonadaceae bacterium]